MLSDKERERGEYRTWRSKIHCKDGSTKTIAWTNVCRQNPVPGWWAEWGMGAVVGECSVPREGGHDETGSSR